MIIKLSPVRSESPLTVVKYGDALEVNAVLLDFSQLPDGASLPAAAVGNEFVVAPIERINGELVVTLMLPHAADASEATRFPVDLHPADGQVRLPGLDIVERLPATAGAIDWSQIVTAEMKQAAAAAELLALVQAETARLRKISDDAIAPLQDAMDLGEATAEEGAELTAWKRYRVALNRLPDQPGYPNEITWPAPPA